MDKTWIVACPQRYSEKHANRVHAWTLTKEQILGVGRRYGEKILDCYVCHHSFSLIEGISEAFTMDLDFLILYFANNTVQSGNVIIRLGWIRPVKFPKRFEKQPTVYLTISDSPVNAVAGDINAIGFRVFTGRSLEATKEEYQVAWSAYGSTEEIEIPIWRKILSLAKNDQLRKDFRLEVVNLESAFEIFVKEHLKPLLQQKGIIGQRLDWVLRRGIDLFMSKWFKVATGQEASERYGELHERWQKEAKDLRNDVVHHGAPVDSHSSQLARKAIIDYILAIEPEAAEHFMVSVSRNIDRKKPVEVFGVGTLRAGETDVTIDFSLGELDRELVKTNPYVTKYREFLKQGNYEGALTYANKTLNLVPDHMDALNTKILSLNQLKLFEDTIGVCEQAVAIDPDNTFALYHENLALIHLGRNVEAQALCDKVISIDPYHVPALCDRGLNLQRLNKPKDAIVEYNKVLDIYPADIPALINKGSALSESGLVREAIECWDKALKIDPLNPYALANKKKYSKQDENQPA